MRSLRGERGGGARGAASRPAPAPQREEENRSDEEDAEYVPSGVAYDHRLMRRLLADLHPVRHLLVLGVFVLVAASLLELAGPWLIKVIIDDYIGGGRMNELPRMALIYLAVVGGTSLLRYAQVVISQDMALRVMLTLRDRLFAHLQRLPLSFYDRQPVGRLMTRVTNDVESLNEMFSSGVVAIFGDVVALAGIVVAMLLLDVKLALVCFAVIPFLFFASWLFRRKVRAAYGEIRKRLARINAFLQENISGISVVQVFGRESANRARFAQLNGDYLDAFLRTIFYYAVFFPVVEIIGALAVVGIISYGGVRVLDGALSVGVMVAFVQYVERFFMPIRDLSEKYNIMQSAMAASERIFGLLDQQPEPGAWRGGAPVERAGGRGEEEEAKRAQRAGAEETESGAEQPLKGEIAFERVSFGYQPGEPVLRELDFRIGAGEKVALVGATGAGKTSIVSLLMRFYDVHQGRVLVDGRDVRSYPPRALRRRIGLVLQDPFLRTGTVWENLVLERPEATREEVERAARMVNAHRVIERLAKGYDTEVLERGSNFSTGEKQLLAFARVLIGQPSILVLDEATSSVDLETELLIQEGIAHLMEGRTSVVIAHRLSTIRDVDRLLVLHKGRLREQGTHEELLAADGLYARLAAVYYGEEATRPQEALLPEGGEGDPDLRPRGIG